MQAVAKEIHESETLVNVEDRIASVNEIFRLQDADEYSAAEKMLPVGGAGAGARRWCWRRAAARAWKRSPRTRPKVMLPVAGKPLLRLAGRRLQEARHQRHHRGGRLSAREAIDTAGIKLAVNEKPRADRRARLAGVRGHRQKRVHERHRDRLRRPAVPQLYPARPGRDATAPFSVVVDSSQTAPSNQTRARLRLVLGLGDDRDLFGRKLSPCKR